MAVCSVSILEMNFKSRHFFIVTHSLCAEFKVQMSPKNIFMPHFTVASYGSEISFS